MKRDSQITPHRSDLFKYVTLNAGVEVTIADCKKLCVYRRGTVELKGLDDRRVKLMDVSYTPRLERRLLSAGRLAECGLSVDFRCFLCLIRGASSAIALGNEVGKAILLDFQQEEARFDTLIKTQRSTNDIPAVKRGIEKLGGGCMKDNHTVTSFPLRYVTKASHVLELVHTDVMEPMITLSKGGAKHVLTLVDDYLMYVVAYFLKKKSEVVGKLKEF
uniref:Retrovirus-related Pol polyprotein from transposon TNT 1-94-like beta-barrel domain-containing protein n=1 Tax=Peronospora matthiolae TaxID=2874970 RepID=A0AAV1TRB8_9STRA